MNPGWPLAAAGALLLAAVAWVCGMALAGSTGPPAGGAAAVDVPRGSSLVPGVRLGMLPPTLRLRGGGARRKGEQMKVNKGGSWNVDGQWAKGSSKIKYMQTQDGFGLSRARMRRERKKWKRDYGDEGPGAQAEDDALFGKEEDDALFAPDGLASKIAKRDERHQAAAQKRAMREQAQKGSARGAKQAVPSWDARAADGLDKLAAQALRQEVEREKRAPGHGHAFQVSGAGEEGVNGLYLPDVEGGHDTLGKSFRKGDYVLLFEQKGKMLTNAELGRGALKRDRWLIFNDELGVHGNRPYYHLVGSFGSFGGEWKSASGRFPPPKVRSHDPDLDNDEDEDEDGGKKKSAKKPSHRERWLVSDDEEESESEGKAEEEDDAKLFRPGHGNREDAWKDLAAFAKKKKNHEDDGDDEYDDDPLGVDLSSEDGSMAEVDARLAADLENTDVHRLDDEAGMGKDVGFVVPRDDTAAPAKNESESEEASVAGDDDDDDDLIDSEEIKKRREWNQKVAQRQMEEEGLMHEMIQQGMGFKEIERTLKERRGEYKGVMKAFMDAKAKAEGKGDEPPEEEKVKIKPFWKKAPRIDLEPFPGGRVELAVSAKGPKGQKIKSTKYRTVAAALWHASELGGGVISLAKGEYDETETLFVGARTTIRAKDKARVVLRGPRGRPVLACDDSSARVLVEGIHLERQSRKRDPAPAVHIDTADWAACVRISRGIVRLTDCKVSGERAVGCLVGKRGLLQLASCKIQHCGADGVAAVEGGTIVANHTLFSRNGDNGVSAQGHGSTIRLGQCNVCNNGNNGISSVHGSKIIAKSCALDSNKGSGGYACGLPIVALGLDLDYGTSMKPGADLELTDCRIRSNTEHGVQVVQLSFGTLLRCSSSFNGESGASAVSANLTVFRSRLYNNTVHGVSVESFGWANISMSNISHNEQDGVGVFGVNSEAWVSACRITHNTWGVVGNEKGELTLQGEGNVVKNNTGIDQFETLGGRVFYEYRGPIHPVLDKSRHLANRRTTTRADMEQDSSAQWSFADRDEGELQWQYHSDDESEGSAGGQEEESSEDYDAKMWHTNKPGDTRFEEVGDIESSE